jgi:hypothetical protein
MTAENVLWILAWAAGLVYSVLVGAFFVKRIVELMWQKAGVLERQDLASLSLFSGMLDRAIFAGALQLNLAGFVPVWLAYKTYGASRDWDRPRQVGNQSIPARTVRHIFLIGNGLNVLYGVTGWKVIHFIQGSDWVKLAAVAVGLVLATLVLEFWIRRRVR